MNQQFIFFNGVQNKYYLSPYVDIYKISEKRIMMKRRDTHKQIVITLPQTSLVQEFITALEKGIDDSEFVSYLGSKEVLNLFLEKGVLE